MEQTPFGEVVLTTEGLRMPMRFPGQYADIESGFSYNYFRDYDPSLGRYVQSDPIGLLAGMNSFSYAGLAPLEHIDPDGKIVKEVIIIGAVIVTFYHIYDFFEEYREAADAAKEDRDKYNKVLDALGGRDPVDPELIEDFQNARRKTVNETLDIIKSSPPGTSITGPVNDPLNKAEATAILIQEGLKNIFDQSIDESHEDTNCPN